MTDGLGASFVNACDQVGTDQKVFPVLPDCKQQKDVGLVVEIFSGTCRLSKACRKYGLRALPVDKDPKRAESCAVASYDLTDRQQYETLVEVLTAERESLVHAHCAPSCGTASRARGRRIPGVPLHMQPKPLRSDDFPHGLPDLTEKDRARVDCANASYKATTELILLLVGWGVSVSIENPANSLFWKTSWIAQLIQALPGGHDTILDHCMHGGARDKTTKFWSYNPLRPEENMLGSLAVRCDGNHTHKSWKASVTNGVVFFPTKEEAAYPTVLCERLASIFLFWAKARNLDGPQDLVQQVATDEDVGKRQLFTGQPRTKTLLQAVSEFGHFVQVAVPINCDNLQPVIASLPKGAKPTSRVLQRGFCRDAFKAAHGGRMVIHADLRNGQDYEIVSVGVPRNPTDFMRAAQQVGHPRGHLVRTSKAVEKAIEANLEWPDHKLFAHRASIFKSWLQKAAELRKEEAELHHSLPDHLKKILSNKKLLLWKHILVSLEYEDAKIIDEIIQGFSLTGWARESGVFDKRVRAAAMTVDQLSGVAMGLNASVVGSLKRGPWTELDKDALDETVAEVDKGWLSECPEVDMRRHFVAKRFPIQQRNKMRLIDDFSICGVNATVGLPERLRVESVDQVVATLLAMLRSGRAVGKLPLTGRTFDLKAAYKQFGVNVEEANRLKIAIRAGPEEVKYYNVLALPFGATGSVVAFLRVAASLAYIGTKGLLLCWSSFFDDFTAIAPERLVENTQFYVEALFRLLGVDYAAEGEKAPPFGQVFRSLGLQFDLNGADTGTFSLGHTETRRKELLEHIGAMLSDETGLVGMKELERLHGRLVWFNSFVFGRTLKAAVAIVSKHSRANSTKVRVEDSLKDALTVLQHELAKDEPLIVTEATTRTWTVYTDGAYEPDGAIKASVGAVLVDEQGLVIECFGIELQESLREEFLKDSNHPIYELEIFPVLLALRTWQQRLCNCQVVFYLDNDAARSGLIRADGSTRLAKAMIGQFVSLEKTLRILPWFARVPSASNPSDDASRLNFQTPWLLGVPRPAIVLPAHLSQWGIL